MNAAFIELFTQSGMNSYIFYLIFLGGASRAIRALMM